MSSPAVQNINSQLDTIYHLSSQEYTDFPSSPKSKANPKSRPKKRTRKRSSESSRPRWPCRSLFPPFPSPNTILPALTLCAPHDRQIDRIPCADFHFRDVLCYFPTGIDAELLTGAEGIWSYIARLEDKRLGSNRSSSGSDGE